MPAIWLQTLIELRINSFDFSLSSRLAKVGADEELGKAI